MYRPKVLQFAEAEYGQRFISLHHQNDEAINGLQSLKRLNINLFGRHFAVSAFSFVSIFLFPLLIVILATQPTLVRNFEALVSGGEAFGAPSIGLHDNLTRIADIFAGLITKWLAPLLLKYAVSDFFVAISYAALAYYMIGPFLFIPVSLALTYFVILVARRVSSLLSRFLNRLTQSQMRKAGFGNDTIGEVSVDAGNSLSWFTLSCPALPGELAKEITDAANKEAPGALVKFRDGINQLALSKDKEAKAFFFSEYLTWDELIHCSYFGVPRFRMLVAYAIAHSPGFRPSAAFKSHPDYELVARWYEEIQPKPEGLPAAAPASR